ncbi:MAG: DUF1489 family protein [Alphaproteobacteria bacterium]|nr:MAG: DUF1489 family protein [Alphaproteobacteria bacterium]
MSGGPGALNLVKLCVGVDEVGELEAHVARRQARGERMVHVTRMRPRRAEELLAGGSLYWVIGGAIRARQRLLALEAVTGADGVRRCALVLEPRVIRTRPLPRRPFQGWRYLAGRDAPADLPAGAEGEPLPAAIAAELERLGVR